MKRWIAALAVIMYLFFTSALADTADYMGTWVKVRESSFRDRDFLIIHLESDGAVYFIAYEIDDTGTVFERGYYGHWSVNEDGSLSIPTGENLRNDYYLGSDGFLHEYSSDGFFKYTKVGAVTVNNSPTPSPVPDPVSDDENIILRVGVYTSGEDFPSGRYIVSVPESVYVARITIYRNSSDTIGKTFWFGQLYGGSTAILDFPDGSRVELIQNTVTLEPYGE